MLLVIICEIGSDYAYDHNVSLIQPLLNNWPKCEHTLDAHNQNVSFVQSVHSHNVSLVQSVL